MESSSAPATTSGEAPSASHPPSTTYVQTDERTFKEIVQRLTGPYQEPPPTSTPIPNLPSVRRPALELDEQRVASRPRLSFLKPLFSPRPPPPEFMFSWPHPLTPLVSPSTQLSGLSIFEGYKSPLLPPPHPPPPPPPPYPPPRPPPPPPSYPPPRPPPPPPSYPPPLPPPPPPPHPPPPPPPPPPSAVEVPELNEEEEEKAIREGKFYLHPSPRSQTRSEPKLLQLFPLTPSRRVTKEKRRDDL